MSLQEQKSWIRHGGAGSSAQSRSSANDKSARCIARCGWLEGMKCTVKVTTGTALQLRIKGNSLIKVEQRTRIWMISKSDIDRKKTFILIAKDFYTLLLNWQTQGQNVTGVLVSAEEFSFIHFTLRSFVCSCSLHSHLQVPLVQSFSEAEDTFRLTPNGFFALKKPTWTSHMDLCPGGRNLDVKLSATFQQGRFGYDSSSLVLFIYVSFVHQAETSTAASLRLLWCFDSPDFLHR